MTYAPSTPTERLPAALPFWGSLALIPIVAIAAARGGAAILLIPAAGWWLFTFLDLLVGKTATNADPDSPDTALFWHSAITLIWPPLQILLVFGTIAFATRAAHLSNLEAIGLAAGLGVVSGTIGVNYAHELMHQSSRLERTLGDLLMTSVLYGHFRSEHLLVHHRYVATPRDTVTARKGQNFHRAFPRVLGQSLKSAWTAEVAKLARAGRPASAARNPFWRYACLQLMFLTLALTLGGMLGLAMFATQALVAIWQLELVNFVEHYGLTRKHLGNGTYEHVKPRHSWNAAHRTSNWLLINLQRHSDHHYKPNRRYPLLQNYDSDEAPQLPFGYPTMTAIALIPPLWRRVMNPKVNAWRKHFYPEIDDWVPYNKGTNPMPK